MRLTRRRDREPSERRSRPGAWGVLLEQSYERDAELRLLRPDRPSTSDTLARCACGGWRLASSAACHHCRDGAGLPRTWG